MWGIQIRPEVGRIKLPLITAEQITMLAGGLLIFRIGISYILEKCFVISPRKEHNINTLEFSYFYHLAIIILGMSELNWNMFDLQIWIFSYAFIGMMRKAIYIISIERNILLNDYSYNNKIMRLLIYSRITAYILIPASLIYIQWINLSFLGLMFKVISLLCFPTIMLMVDSIFLWLISRETEKHLIYFYNQNINEMPPTYRLQIWHNFVGCIVKTWHFYNLTIISAKSIFDQTDFLDCLWIISILSSLYSSFSGCISSTIKYHSMKKLNKCIDRIFKKVDSKSNQICIICMQPLLNCHELSPCGHIFHYKCFLQWVQTKQQCPVCRVRINLNL